MRTSGRAASAPKAQGPKPGEPCAGRPCLTMRAHSHSDIASSSSLKDLLLLPRRKAPALDEPE
jgi:hypothetical protein